MNNPIISVQQLTRSFGTVHAVNDISFDVQKGDVIGFIGANGAGKTTTMRILATLDYPTSGTVEICGHDVVNRPNLIRSLVGWMPDHFGTYNNVDVWEYLDFFARAFGLKGQQRKDRLAEVMAFTDLDVLENRPSSKLSKGQMQRLCLARTLLSDPQVLILDEPAAGLDPKARLEFKNLVKLLKEQGKTIFISSHILSELEEMCDSLLFIDGGKIVHQGAAETLKYDNNTQQLRVQVRTSGELIKLEQWVAQNEQVASSETLKDGAILHFTSETLNDDYLHQMLKAMIHAGIEVYEFQRVQQKLEDAFVDILRAQPTATPPPLPKR